MSEFPASTAYRAAEVLTATPQRLHLMLVEGAIRFCRHAQDLWQQGQMEAVHQSLGRCRAVLGEMLAAVRAGSTDESRKLAAIYAFVFQQLAEAQLRSEPHRLDEALRILDVECETWRQVCQRYGAVREADQARPFQPPRPAALTSARPDSVASGGFSFQA